jgi:hypothetical protein
MNLGGCQPSIERIRDVKMLYELLQGAGLLGFIFIALVVAAIVETGKQNRLDEQNARDDKSCNDAKRDEN